MNDVFQDRVSVWTTAPVGKTVVSASRSRRAAATSGHIRLPSATTIGHTSSRYSSSVEVLTVEGAAIGQITAFATPELVPRLGLPERL